MIYTELNEQGNLECAVTKLGTFGDQPANLQNRRYAVTKMILHAKPQMIHQITLDVLDAEWKLPLISRLSMMFRWTFWGNTSEEQRYPIFYARAM